jgi:hypothetical protein
MADVGSLGRAYRPAEQISRWLLKEGHDDGAVTQLLPTSREVGE